MVLHFLYTLTKKTTLVKFDDLAGHCSSNPLSRKLIVELFTFFYFKRVLFILKQYIFRTTCATWLQYVRRHVTTRAWVCRCCWRSTGREAFKIWHITKKKMNRHISMNTIQKLYIIQQLYNINTYTERHPFVTNITCSLILPYTCTFTGVFLQETTTCASTEWSYFVLWFECLCMYGMQEKTLKNLPRRNGQKCVYDMT